MEKTPILMQRLTSRACYTVRPSTQRYCTVPIPSALSARGSCCSVCVNCSASGQANQIAALRHGLTTSRQDNIHMVGLRCVCSPSRRLGRGPAGPSLPSPAIGVPLQLPVHPARLNTYTAPAAQPEESTRYVSGSPTRTDCKGQRALMQS